MPTPVVSDLSHHYWDNGHKPDFAAAKQAGLVGVIFKASQGAAFRDKTYDKTRVLAKNAGLLWGAYHFATSAQSKSQLANFLAAALPEAEDLVVIDFERNGPDPASSASAATALALLKGCEDKLGRRPVLYTGSYMYDLFGKKVASDFAGYRVWWARYSAAAQVHPTWPSYWLWQFTDGMNGPQPRKVPGIGYADFSHFDGTAAQLRDQWAG